MPLKTEMHLELRRDHMQVSPENPDIMYLDLEEHLRLIFRDGAYAGFYDPALESVL